MENISKAKIENKKEKYYKNKKSILITSFASILKSVLAIALFFMFASIAYAGDVIVENGKLNVDSKLYVADNGNVGIGMTNPEAKLHISQASGIALKFDNRQLITFNQNTNPETVGNIIGAQGFYGFGVSHGQLHYRAGKGFETLDVSNDGPSMTHASSSFAPIYAGALVIGQMTNPGNYPQFSGAANGATILGNVGIGTTSPTRKLHVLSATENIVQSESTGVDSTAYYILNNDATQWSMKVMGTNSDALEFRNDNTGSQPVTMTTAGNVGIGTTSPSEKLDVAGDIKASGQLASQGGKVRRDFVTWSTSASSPLNIHIKTNIPIRSSVMYRILVEGYNYGQAQAINSDAVGYTYSGWSCTGATQQNNYANGVSISQYCSGDGFVVIKLTAAASTYFLGFGASAWFVNPTGEAFDISATVYQQDANL